MSRLLSLAALLACCSLSFSIFPTFASAQFPTFTPEHMDMLAAMSAMPASPTPGVVIPEQSARIAAMIAPTDDLTPGKLNAMNFTRPEGQRLFYLYVPSTYDASKAYPLFFYFHGYQGDWAQGAVELNMTDDAERAGYFAIFGRGTFASSGQRGWNGGVCCLFNTSTIVDDVQFARTALAMVQAAANIDAKRVYTTGWSNGGFMSERLGCEAADIFAGVAADASAVGILPGGEAGLASCDKSFGLSSLDYLHFHGTADSVVSWSVRSAHLRTAPLLITAKQPPR